MYENKTHSKQLKQQENLLKEQGGGLEYPRAGMQASQEQMGTAAYNRVRVDLSVSASFFVCLFFFKREPSSLYFLSLIEKTNCLPTAFKFKYYQCDSPEKFHPPPSPPHPISFSLSPLSLFASSKFLEKTQSSNLGHLSTSRPISQIDFVIKDGS